MCLLCVCLLSSLFFILNKSVFEERSLSQLQQNTLTPILRLINDLAKFIKNILATGFRLENLLVKIKIMHQFSMDCCIVF